MYTSNYMQLTKEGLKNYGRMMERFESYERKYRQGLPEEKRAKPMFVHTDEFNDNNYELTTYWVTNSMSREEGFTMFRKMLDKYYLGA